MVLNRSFYTLATGTFIVLISLLLLPSISFAQNDTPCDCVQRWTEGAHWNSNGTINDLPTAPPENGIVRCGNSAETQANVQSIVSGCNYDSTAFNIDISGIGCVDPSSGNIFSVANPTQNKAILWVNFDVKPNAGSFQIQIQDNQDIGWALYYSTLITNGVSLNSNGTGDSISGSCSNLLLVACGIESGFVWNTIPVPNFLQTTNYYMALWDETPPGNNNLAINNFKVRFGCGGADILICNIQVTTPPITVCNANGTYTVRMPVDGINGEFYAYDPNANNIGGLSTPICLTNPSSTNVVSDTLELTYNYGTNYNILIFEANDTVPATTVTPSASCDDPINSEGCRDTVSGSAPNCCVLVPSMFDTNITCNGFNDGTATVNVSGGVAPFNYLWSDGQTNQTATGLIAGQFTVLVTDLNSCTVIDTANISEPPLLTVNCVVDSNVTCNGLSDGGATVTANGGTPVYSYAWSNGQTNASAVNLAAGTYTVTVSDANNCTATCSVTITELAVLTTSCVVDSNVTCTGLSDGGATVTPGGIASPFTYLWSNGQTDSSAVNLTAGTYTVTITNANNCTATCSVTITEPVFTAGCVLDSNVTCNGLSDGGATVTVNGGTPGYSYAWSNGQSNASAVNLAAGTYTVTVTDANLCTATCSVTITEPALLTAGCVLDSNVTCNGLSNGGATVTANGGTPGYSYVWSNGQSNASAVNLAAGNYTVTVTDANNCTTTCSVTITEPVLLTAGCAVDSNVTCSGLSDGGATVTANGGAPVYNYTWSNGQSNASAVNLAAGTYTVTVTDANLCTATCSIMITGPPSYTCNIIGSDILCNGGLTGSATVTINGGIPGYTFSWSNGQTNALAINLSAGTYTVTATDANSCTTTCSVTITELTLLTAGCAVDSNVTCNGLSDGGATVTANGGTPAYSYAWSNGQSNASAVNLAAGTYTVTVMDANLCTATCSVTITEPAVLTAGCAVDSNVTCNGLSDGGATVTANGGTPGYSYAWSNGQSNASAVNLAAGTYTVTVTDVNLCTATCSVTITEPAVLTAGCVLDSNVTCNGLSDGGATVTGNGGTTGYSYTWSNGQSNASTVNLATGTYTVTVNDANNCTATCSVTITEPAVLAAGCVLDSNATCNGISDGGATVTGNGGTPGYSYTWSNGQTNASSLNLAAGTYTVTVTDANLCTVTCSVTITEPSVLTAGCAVDSNVTCNGLSDGGATVTANGGTPVYTYEWSNGQSNASAVNLSSGSYTVTVTDANGCTETCSVTILEPTLIIVSPTGINPLCNGDANGSAIANASGGLASTVSVFSEDLEAWTGGDDVNPNGSNSNGWINSNGGTQVDWEMALSGHAGSPGTGPDVDHTGGGRYIYLETSGAPTNGFDELYSPGIDLSSLGTAELGFWYHMFGDDMGTLTLEVSSDSSTWTPVFIIFGQQQTASSDPWIQALVNVDAYAGGTIYLRFVGSYGGGIEGDMALDDISISGSLAYSYSWSNGQTNEVATNLTSGTYTVTVTDANSCTGTASVTLVDPALLLVSSTFTNPLCAGDSTGTATANANGGTTIPAISTLSTLFLNNNLGNLGGAVYFDITVGARDININSFDINTASTGNPISLNVYTLIGSSVGNETNAGAWTLSGTGTGAEAGLNNPSLVTLGSAITLTAGTSYGIALELDINHSHYYSGTGTNPSPGLLTYFDSYIALNFGVATNVPFTAPTFTPRVWNGQINYTVIGGLTYSWNTLPVTTTSTATGLSAGTYTVTVTDVNLCTVTASVSITDPPILIANCSIDSNVTCFGLSDGGASSAPTGGTGFYSYLWSNGQTNASAVNLSVGTYSVIVTDSLGCTDTCLVTITEPAVLTAICIVDSNVTCIGLSDGGATVTTNGGTPAYSYLWSNGQTNASVVNLAAGTYTVTVNDANNCTATCSVTITEPAILTAGCAVDSNVTCNGLSDGGATVTAIGGNPVYTFAWSNGQTNASAINLVAGTYTVTVTDANNCIATSSVTIIEPLLLTAGCAVDSNATCNGLSDGGATVTANGGTPTYTFEWSNGQTNASAINLSSGTYTITVSDANLCTATCSITIAEPAALLLTTIQINVSCVGSDTGSIDLSVSGGIPGYTLLWSNSETTEDISGLTAGTYTVTVIDAIGCTKTTSATITEPGGPPCPAPQLFITNGIDSVTCGDTSVHIFDIGPVGLGNAGPIPVSLINIGNDTLIISALAISGPDSSNFIIPPPILASLPISLAPSDSLNFNIIFVPGGQGQKNATLAVTSNDPNNGNCEVPVGGSGIVLPQIACPADTTIEWGFASDTSVTGIATEIASGDTTVVFSYSDTTIITGICPNIRRIERTWIVVDTLGNSDTCIQIIHLSDTTAPTAVCQNISVYLDSTGTTSITADTIDNSSTDNCGIDSIYIDISSFNCLNIGANNVKLFVIDSCGLMDSCVAIVTVLDTSTIPNAGADNLNNIVCSTSPTALTVDLTSYLEVAAAAGGIWSETTSSGADLSNPNSVNLSTIPSGTYQFEYTVESYSGCQTDSAIIGIIVNNTNCSQFPWNGE